MSITIGKWRRLQQTASSRGTFCILAIDHRGPVRRALEKEAAAAISDERLTELKQDVVRELGSAATAVLLDPETGVGPCITTGALDGHTGLITALDTGSTGDPLPLAGVDKDFLKALGSTLELDSSALVAVVPDTAAAAALASLQAYDDGVIAQTVLDAATEKSIDDAYAARVA